MSEIVMTESDAPAGVKTDAAKTKGARTGPPAKKGPTPPKAAPLKGATSKASFPKAEVPLSRKAAKLKPAAKVNSSVASLKNVELAIKAIEKFTGQRPIGLDRRPLPCVSSGSMNVDHIIGGVLAPDKTGPLCPGYPRGHITELYGPEASGKTTLALEAIVEVQRQGGNAIFLDFEHALSHKYAEDLGVDLDPTRCANIQPDNMEQGLDIMRIGVMSGVDLIVVDSVAAMVPKADMEKNFEDPDKIGARAAKLASALPKIVKFLKPNERNPLGTAVIFINQTRALINTGGPPGGGGGGDTTSGGKALKFFAYLRLQTTCIRTERLKLKDPVTKKEKNVPFGSHTQVKVIKSKIDAKQGQTADIFIRFGQGIDDVYTTIEAAVAHKLVKKTGAFFELNAEKFQGREKLRKFLLSNRVALDELQGAVLKSIRHEAEMDPDTVVDSEAEEVDALITSTFGGDDGTSDDESMPEDVEIEDEV